MKNASLQVKLIGALMVLFLVILGAMICLTYFSQRSHDIADAEHTASVVAETVYNGMISPMSAGDGKTVEKQMIAFKKNMNDLEIYIFGLNKGATYASEKEKAGKDLTKEIKSPELLRAIDRLLQEGKSSGTAYDEVLEDKTYLSVLRPILNEPQCHQCHESSRPILGGLMVRQNAEKVYSDLAALRNRNIITGAAGCLIAIVALYFLTLRLIVKPVQRVMEGLSGGAGQVTVASSQVSSASQSLAEGASEQAAGIEETSSSIEEMASMTKQNADNANQANHLMTETGQVVEEANQAMRELTRSMTEITQASEETAKIIKTIDEIAFQTNLLALNAAVEAARAGEAGAGFAVVADEVRNLALRASDAAKNTAGLIEGSVKKIKIGSEIVSRTNDAFGKVAVGAKKVGELVGEIAAASNEQAQGIEQINRAVVEMDKVVQRNASSAEESASAAEEMNAQAEEMKGFVGELVSMVGGQNGNGFLSEGAQPRKNGNGRHLGAPIDHPKVQREKGREAKAPVPKPAAVKPDQVIPMEESEFKEF